MSARGIHSIAALLPLLTTVPVSAALAQEYNGLPTRQQATSQTTDRLIVRWRPVPGADTRARKLSATGVAVTSKQSLDDDTDVLQLPQRLTGSALADAIARLQADSAVVYAAPDLRRRAHAVTSDLLLTSQWYLSNMQPAATRTDAAWDITTGSPNVIVAVLDTGVRFEHPDLGHVEAGGKLLAGYDFVGNVAVANDGDARDADPSDPGDWVDAADRAQPAFSDCDTSSSSWHGTRVAGLVGALTNNAEGVAGAGFNTQVLPVRVLGKCGGFDSDIIAAMRWAAGLPVSGVPDNPTPASVINLSLGGDGVCTSAYQSVVDDVTARGVLIVVSAGNEGGPVSAPANCNGVLGVAGIRHIGTKVGFSNLGPEIGIGAPGGNCVNTGFGQPCLFSIVVAINSGTTTPAASTYTDQISYNVGTSFSAPQVAAAAGLMRSINSHLTPANVITLVRRTASVFPVNSTAGIPTCHTPTSPADLQAAECNCTTTTCGAGMLNAGAAVDAAQRPFAVLQTDGSATIGATIALDASSSFASNNRTITNYEWSTSNVTGTAPSITAPTEPVTSLQITAATQFTLQLVVTDDHGGKDTQHVSFATPAPPPPSPSPPTSPSSGGGGGAFDWMLLCFAVLGVSVVNGRQDRARDFCSDRSHRCGKRNFLASSQPSRSSTHHLAQ
ncbi:MAG TPA: S8 family serine peptidase [Povalibacter sp.]